MEGLTSDLFIQLTTTLAHLSNMTLNTSNFGGEVSNETLLEGKTFLFVWGFSVSFGVVLLFV